MMDRPAEIMTEIDRHIAAADDLVDARLRQLKKNPNSQIYRDAYFMTYGLADGLRFLRRRLELLGLGSAGTDAA